MDHLEAAGWIAHERGVEQGGVVMRPRDATCTFTLPGGGTETLDYDALIAEGERLRAQVPPPKPRAISYSFEYPSPIPGGRR